MRILDQKINSLEIPYLDYLGLKEKPFSMTPDPEFYFESRSHKKATDYLKFFVSQREGFALIHGDVGTGKTLLCRRFLDSLDKNNVNVALILNPIMTETEFLGEVLREFNIPAKGQEGLFEGKNQAPGMEVVTKKDMLNSLEEYLLAQYRNGKECILAIDEAQLLSNEMFDFLRVLSNFETNKDKLLHIVLFGQEEVVSKLAGQRMRYLSQRISVVHHLRPLSTGEVGMYITHRLLKAGSNGLIQFSSSVVSGIHRVSRGYPRLINIICDRCLLMLYAKSKTQVDQKILNEVLREESICTLIKELRAAPGRLRKGYVIALGITLVIFILFLVFRGKIQF
ncbi:MAG: hypothetical protein A4E65_03159 [Syntrophorhabdus sp. PtaU1.Bin153]|nr:MAG: hypothetical protein A4E65_03159 [Syntrophorhabdus sp. PtaU1.Bin153]